jgi:hypothetical protein
LDCLDHNQGTDSDFSYFETQLMKKRDHWTWLVSTREGKGLMRGSEASRLAASYRANQALFLLLGATRRFSARGFA